MFFFVHWINAIFHINLRNSVKYSSGMIYFCYSHTRQEIYFSSPACLCVRRSRGGGAAIPVTHSSSSLQSTKRPKVWLYFTGADNRADTTCCHECNMYSVLGWQHQESVRNTSYSVREVYSV